MTKNYYDILNVDKEVTTDELEIIRINLQIFGVISSIEEEAFNVLLDDVRRKEYDETIRVTTDNKEIERKDSVPLNHKDDSQAKVSDKNHINQLVGVLSVFFLFLFINYLSTNIQTNLTKDVAVNDELNSSANEVAAVKKDQKIEEFDFDLHTKKAEGYLEKIDYSDTKEFYNNMYSESDVIEIQRDLTEYGYDIGKCDGFVDRFFVAAVVHFQEDNGLFVDGKFGQETRNKIIELTSDNQRGGNSAIISDSIEDSSTVNDTEMVPVETYMESSYTIDELDMRIAIPSDYVVFTRDIDANDPNLSLYGLTKDSMSSLMTSGNIYLNAWDSDVNYLFYVTMIDSSLGDFNLLSDATLSTLATSFESEYKSAGITYIKSEVYQHDQAKFLKIYISQPNGDSTAYGLQYYTVYADKAIIITMQSYSGTINDSKENILKSIVDSAKFGTDP